MKDRDAVETTSGPIFGREFIIILIVVFSGLSFTLGFFVGKNTVSETDRNMQPVEHFSPKKQEVKTAPAATALSQATEQQPALVQSEASVQSDKIKPQTSSTEKISEIQAEQPKTVKQPEQKTATKAVNDNTDKSSQKTGQPVHNSEKQILYTVQLGAFKNPAEAKQLKARMVKKGYKLTIVVEKDRKGNKVYKVRTGEYKDKKDAEVHALKLKKTEDLHTFVTTKTD